LPIGLRVFYRGRNRLDAQVVIEGLQASVNKLSTIISDYCVGDAELANNASPYEILDVFGRDGCKGFGLDPFGKVVDSHEEELGLPFSWRKGTDDVHPLDGERPWGDDTVQLFRPYVMERAELLALGTFLHVLGTVTLDGRPVVAGPQDHSDHRPRPEWFPQIPSWISTKMYLARLLVMHFSRGVEYPLLYKSSLIMVYRAHCCFITFSCSGFQVPFFMYWMMGVIQLSVSASASSIARHSVSDTLGCLRVSGGSSSW